MKKKKGGTLNCQNVKIVITEMSARSSRKIVLITHPLWMSIPTNKSTVCTERKRKIIITNILNISVNLIKYSLLNDIYTIGGGAYKQTANLPEIHL